MREARIEDIPQIQVVRNAVRENTLSDPDLVTDKDCEEFLFDRGKGWVCEMDNQIVGFSIVDLKENNIWALCLHPDFDFENYAHKVGIAFEEWTSEKETQVFMEKTEITSGYVSSAFYKGNSHVSSVC